jgi:predicted nuclease of predicted toxin-antitoxin system
VKRILLDQGLAPRAAEILRTLGFEASHVAGIGMQEADDAAILSRAREEGAVCVTLDQDFHTHLALASSGSPSVALLRVQGLDAQGQADLICTVFERCEDALRDGAAITADLESIRIRRLPLK